MGLFDSLLAGKSSTVVGTDTPSSTSGGTSSSTTSGSSTASSGDSPSGTSTGSGDTAGASGSTGSPMQGGMSDTSPLGTVSTSPIASIDQGTSSSNDMKSPIDAPISPLGTDLEPSSPLSSILSTPQDVTSSSDAPSTTRILSAEETSHIPPLIDMKKETAKETKGDSLFPPIAPIHAGADPQVEPVKDTASIEVSPFGNIAPDPLKPETKASEISPSSLFGSLLDDTKTTDDTVSKKTEDAPTAQAPDTATLLFGKKEDTHADTPSPVLQKGDILEQADMVFRDSIARLDRIKGDLQTAQDKSYKEADEHHKKMEEEKKLEREKREHGEKIGEEIAQIEERKMILTHELQKKEKSTPAEISHEGAKSPEAHNSNKKKKPSTQKTGSSDHKDEYPSWMNSPHKKES